MYSWRVGRSSRRFRSSRSNSHRYSHSGGSSVSRSSVSVSRTVASEQSQLQSQSSAADVNSIASNEASRLLRRPEQSSYSSATTMTSPSQSQSQIRVPYSVVDSAQTVTTNSMIDDNDDEYDFERGMVNNDGSNNNHSEQQENTVNNNNNNTNNDEGNESTIGVETDNNTNGGTNTGTNNNNNNTNTNNNTNNNNTNNNNNNGLNQEIQILTNRLRILFFTLTLPILPLGIILSLLILQLVYASFTSPSCGIGHPLRIYTFVTILISTYATKHKAIRNWLFNYDRVRDGMVRPRVVRIYDQCFHLLAILYVYYGTVLLKACQDDMMDVTTSMYPTTSMEGGGGIQGNGNQNHNDMASDAMGIMNTTNTTMTESTCAYSCPELFDSMQRFVFMLKIFVIVLLLPLVCLPFIYVWILRRINTEEAWLTFGRENNGNGGDGSGNGKVVLASEIMEELKDVVLVPLRDGVSHGSFDNEKEEKIDGVGTSTNTMLKKVRIVDKSLLGNDHKTDPSCHNEEDPLLISSRQGDDYDSQTKEWDTTKDCCICMCEFDLYDESGTANKNGDTKSSSKDIVQTRCGHIFHKSCIGSWIGGNWNEELNRLESTTSRALRHGCPLCRADLSPVNDNDNDTDESELV